MVVIHGVTKDEQAARHAARSLRETGAWNVRIIHRGDNYIVQTGMDKKK